MPPIFNSTIGLGTWKMGERASTQSAEIRAIEHAVRIGYTVIDTAEMYANGQAETLVGRALKQLGPSTRERLVMVSKVLPHNASKAGTIKACEASIKRMGCDYLDVYLLHWMGSHPFKETLEGFLELVHRGMIRHYGVSNFDVQQLSRWQESERVMGVEPSAGAVTNQVYYALSARGIEFDLKTHLSANGLSLMAYSPLGAGDLPRHKPLSALAASLGVSAAQLALAWSIRDKNTIAIPKSSTLSRIEDNLAAKDIVLSDETLNALDQIFPPPQRKSALAVL